MQGGAPGLSLPTITRRKMLNSHVCHFSLKKLDRFLVYSVIDTEQKLYGDFGLNIALIDFLKLSKLDVMSFLNLA